MIHNRNLHGENYFQIKKARLDFFVVSEDMFALVHGSDIILIIQPLFLKLNCGRMNVRLGVGNSTIH